MNRREFVAGLTVSTALVSTSRGQSNVVRVGVASENLKFVRIDGAARQGSAAQ